MDGARRASSANALPDLVSRGLTEDLSQGSLDVGRQIHTSKRLTRDLIALSLSDLHLSAEQRPSPRVSKKLLELCGRQFEPGGEVPMDPQADGWTKPGKGWELTLLLPARLDVTRSLKSWASRAQITGIAKAGSSNRSFVKRRGPTTSPPVCLTNRQARVRDDLMILRYDEMMMSRYDEVTMLFDNMAT